MDTNNEKKVETKKPAKSSIKFKSWVAGVLSVIVLVLVIQNRHPVEVELLFWEFHVSGVILLLFVFLIGIVVGYVVRRRR